MEILVSLGQSFWCRFEYLDSHSDLAQAISYYGQAVSATSEYSGNLPWLWISFGLSLVCRSHLGTEPTDLTRAISLFKQAAQSPLGDPQTRFIAAYKWAEASVELDPFCSLEGYKHLMNLVPSVIWLGSTIHYRYEGAMRIADRILDATTAALNCQEFDIAIEWLEEGRSVVWRQMLQLRSSFDNQRQVNKALSDWFKQVARDLDHSSMSQEQRYSFHNTIEFLEQAGQKRRRDAEEWERLVTSARQIPGFSSFLRPKKAIDLAAAVSSGPVVLIHLQKSRCNALVLRPNCEARLHVPLQEFTYEMATQLRTQMSNLLTGRGMHRADNRAPVFDSSEVNDAFEGVLEILWLNLVETILVALDYLVCTRMHARQSI